MHCHTSVYIHFAQATVTASVVAMMRAAAVAGAWVDHFVHGLGGYSLQIGGRTGPMAVRVEGHSR